MLFLSFLPIILIFIIFFILLYLFYGSFHYFYTSLEWFRISSLFPTLFLFFLMMNFFLIFVLFLKLFNIWIPYLPLSNLSSQIINYRRVSCGSSLFYTGICCLNLSTLIIEFISHCLFNSLNIFSWAWFLLFSLSFNLLEFCFSIKLNVLLNFIFVWRCMNVISFQGKMTNQLINRIILFIFAIKIIIHNPVRLRLRVWDY